MRVTEEERAIILHATRTYPGNWQNTLAYIRERVRENPRLRRVYSKDDRKCQRRISDHLKRDVERYAYLKYYAHFPYIDLI